MKGLAINNWTEGFENYLVENKKEFLLGLITLIQLNYKNTSFFLSQTINSWLIICS